MAILRSLALALVAANGVQATCDGNPHAWDRTRRCDAQLEECPDAPWASGCGMCEGVGGIAWGDDNDDMNATYCKPIASPDEVPEDERRSPVLPANFINSGFHEVQIFVKHDPFCIAQIPSMVSNGSHCYKPQEGAFNFDSDLGKLRIDYFESETPFTPYGGANMTEIFYHEKTNVHPHITRYPGFGELHGAACPCIDVGAGILKNDWAADAEYIGREMLGIEYLWEHREVDHFLKGPHHLWVDVETNQTIRMWQPFNGLEVFDPNAWSTGADITGPDDYELPRPCKLLSKVCIDGTDPSAVAGLVESMEEVLRVPSMH